MRDLLFPSSPVLTGSLRAAARAQAAGFVQECRAIVRMLETAEPDQWEFVPGEVACVLHVSPHTAIGRVNTAVGLFAQPRLVQALERGRLGVGHALAVLAQLEHLAAPHAALVLDAVLGAGDSDEAIELTPGELRAAVQRAAIVADADAARRCDRDHRLAYPLGATDAPNLQSLSRRWHRAKQNGWDSHLEVDGALRWTSPTNGVYRRRPKRTIPPPIDKPLPPLDDTG